MPNIDIKLLIILIVFVIDGGLIWLVIFIRKQFKYRRSKNYVHTNRNPMIEDEPIEFVNALAILLGKSWESVYDMLVKSGKETKDMMCSYKNVMCNLANEGYKYVTYTDNESAFPRYLTCRQFAKKFNKGEYVMFTHTNCEDAIAVTVIDGKMLSAEDYGYNTVAFVMHDFSMTEPFAKKKKYFGNIAKDFYTL